MNNLPDLLGSNANKFWKKSKPNNYGTEKISDKFLHNFRKNFKIIQKKF